MSDEAPKTDAPKARRRIRPLYIVLGSVGLLVAVVLGLFLYLTKTPELKTYEDPVGLDERGANTLVYATLASNGYEDPYVSVKPGYVYVAYELPMQANSTQRMDAEDAQYFVLGAASSVAPASGQVVAVQYVDGVAKLSWTVSGQDLLAHLGGDLSASEFESKVTKRDL